MLKTRKYLVNVACGNCVHEYFLLYILIVLNMSDRLKANKLYLYIKNDLFCVTSFMWNMQRYAHFIEALMTKVGASI